MKLAIRSDPQAYLRKQVKDGRYSHLSQAINAAWRGVDSNSMSRGRSESHRFNSRAIVRTVR